MLQNAPRKRPWRLAVPGLIFPAGARENFARLAPRFPEIGLYLLQAGPCLAYGPEDLPEPRPGTRCHVHLPLDLPWADGPGAAFETAARLAAMAAPLAPWGFVLHPPRRTADLAVFVRLWEASGRDPRDILLENVEDAGVGILEPAVRSLAVSLCLDLGHMLAYAQEDVLGLPGLRERVRMLHVYAPRDPDDPRDRDLPARAHRHRRLGALDAAGRRLFRTMLDKVGEETVIVHEVFRESDLEDSLAAFATIVQNGGEW